MQLQAPGVLRRRLLTGTVSVTALLTAVHSGGPSCPPPQEPCVNHPNRCCGPTPPAPTPSPPLTGWTSWATAQRSVAGMPFELSPTITDIAYAAAGPTSTSVASCTGQVRFTLALSPLPLILSYKSEKCLCGAVPSQGAVHRRRHLVPLMVRGRRSVFDVHRRHCCRCRRQLRAPAVLWPVLPLPAPTLHVAQQRLLHRHWHGEGRRGRPGRPVRVRRSDRYQARLTSTVSLAAHCLIQI